MSTDAARRWACLLAGVWTGVILSLACIAAPAAFALLPVQQAGALANRFFFQEAYASLAVSVGLLVLVRRAMRPDIAAGGSVFSTNLLLVMAALFCTLFGYFALQPMMAAARAGQGGLSFAALHGISAAFFIAKALLALALTWRLSKPSGDLSARAGT